MPSPEYALTRRHLLAATSLALVVGSARLASAAVPVPLALVLKPGKLALRPGQPDSDVLVLDAGTDPLRFKRGDELAVTFTNQTARPAALTWHGLDGIPSAEPLIGRPPVPPGGQASLTIPLRHAGTLLCEARLLAGSDDQRSTARAIVVAETAPPEVDRDEVVLIEDWRIDASASTSLYTVNGKATLDVIAKPNERFRFRFINACHRHGIAIKFDTTDVRLMAIDGQPAEPFLARGGVLAMAPGTRIDCYVDAPAAAGATTAIRLAAGSGEAPIQIGRITLEGAPTRPAPLPIPPPLPSNGLPDKLNLAGALRVELFLGGPDWLLPAAMSAAAKPAFRAKRGRTVVLALANSTAAPTVFRLHGHHFRLLDRLDDGWKPFWLDTLVFAPGQVQRVAFAAENPGAYLLESMATDWTAPRMLRSYVVE